MAHGKNLLMLICFLLNYFTAKFLHGMSMILKVIPFPGSIQEAQSEGMLHGWSSKKCDIMILSAGIEHPGCLSSAPPNPVFRHLTG